MKICAVDCGFYIRAFRVACESTLKYRPISSNSPAQLEIKDTINEVKYGCLSSVTCGSIHEGHEWFRDYSQGRQKIFMCLAVLLCEQFCRFANGGAKISIKSYFMRSFFFCLSEFSSSEVLGKITSIRFDLVRLVTLGFVICLSGTQRFKFYQPCWLEKATDNI